MDPHQDVLAVADVAGHQGDMLLAIDRGPEPDRAEVAEHGRQDGLDDTFDLRFGPPHVGDQIRDRNHEKAVVIGEDPALRRAHHRPVIVDQLADGSRGRQPRKARQFHRGLGVAGPAQHAAVHGPQREHMPGPGQLPRLRGTVGEHSDGVGPVMSRDAGRDAVPGIDGYRVGGLLAVLVDRGHRWQIQTIEVGPWHRHADHTRGVADHEPDQLGRRLARGENQVALVLPVRIIDHDHGLAPCDSCHSCRDGVEHHLGFGARLDTRLPR